jgi:hypothetical protein
MNPKGGPSSEIDLSKYSCKDEIVFRDSEGKKLDTESQKHYNASFCEKVSSFLSFVEYDSSDSS